jgi:hypothetical protein
LSTGEFEAVDPNTTETGPKEALTGLEQAAESIEIKEDVSILLPLLKCTWRLDGGFKPRINARHGFALTSLPSPPDASVTPCIPRGISNIAVALFSLQFGKVPEQLVQAASEREEHQRVYEKELDYVDNHAPK